MVPIFQWCPFSKDPNFPSRTGAVATSLAAGARTRRCDVAWSYGRSTALGSWAMALWLSISYPLFSMKSGGWIEFPNQVVFYLFGTYLFQTSWLLHLDGWTCWLETCLLFGKIVAVSDPSLSFEATQQVCAPLWMLLNIYYIALGQWDISLSFFIYNLYLVFYCWFHVHVWFHDLSIPSLCWSCSLRRPSQLKCHHTTLWPHSRLVKHPLQLI